MNKRRLVMVGNGMAGVRPLKELLKIAPGLYDITVFGAEPHPNYNRTLLSPALADEKTLDDIVLNERQWYADHGITLHTGFTVTEVNRVRRMVSAAGNTGETVSAHTTASPWRRVRNPSSCRCQARTFRACWPTATLPTHRP